MVECAPVVVALTHFCENHGPQVLMTTRREPKTALLEAVDLKAASEVSCDACAAFPSQTTRYLVSDCGAQDCVYLSSAAQADGGRSRLHTACLRNLSCEVSASGNFVLFDDDLSHVLSTSFSVRDADARGFRRSYGVMVAGGDRVSVVAAANRLAVVIKTMVMAIQKRAEQRFDANTKVEHLHRRRTETWCKPKNLSVIAGCDIYALVHAYFSRMLDEMLHAAQLMVPSVMGHKSVCHNEGFVSLHFMRHSVVKSELVILLTTLLSGETLEVISKTSEARHNFARCLHCLLPSEAASYLEQRAQTNKWLFWWQSKLSSRRPPKAQPRVHIDLDAAPHVREDEVVNQDAAEKSSLLVGKLSSVMTNDGLSDALVIMRARLVLKEFENLFRVLFLKKELVFGLVPPLLKLGTLKDDDVEILKAWANIYDLL
jgi:hypothetical protein